MSKRQNVNLGNWGGGGRIVSLLLAVAFLMTASVRADLIFYASAEEAKVDGSLPLFSVNFTGNSNNLGNSNLTGTYSFGENTGTLSGSVTRVSVESVPVNGSGNRGRWYHYEFTLAGDLPEGFTWNLTGFTVDGNNSDISDPSIWIDSTSNGFSGGFNTWGVVTILGNETGLGSTNPSLNFTITGYGTYVDGATGNAVPEPATLAVLGLGLAGLGLTRVRRKK